MTARIMLGAGLPRDIAQLVDDYADETARVVECAKAYGCLEIKVVAYLYENIQQCRWVLSNRRMVPGNRRMYSPSIAGVVRNAGKSCGMVSAAHDACAILKRSLGISHDGMLDAYAHIAEDMGYDIGGSFVCWCGMQLKSKQEAAAVEHVNDERHAAYLVRCDWLFESMQTAGPCR